MEDKGAFSVRTEAYSYSVHTVFVTVDIFNLYLYCLFALLELVALSTTRYTEWLVVTRSFVQVQTFYILDINNYDAGVFGATSCIYC